MQRVVSKIGDLPFVKKIESSGKLLYALLITQIPKDDYRDFWTFSEISKKD
jgi:hypothetical protein